MSASFRYRQNSKRVKPRSKSTSKKKRTRDNVKWNSNLTIGVLAIAIISIILTLIVKFYSADYFEIQEIEFLGSQSVNPEVLTDDLSQFKSRNIFLTKKSTVENTLLDTYVYFEDVKVMKIWPNKLYVNIYEREPTLLMINLNGVYVIDEDARIIDIIADDPINITDDDLNVINGMGDPNADYIKEIIQHSWKEENPDLDLEDFDFEKIPISQKLETLLTLQNELSSIISSRLKAFNTKASETKYANLEQVTVYENKKYKEFDFINENILNITKEVINYFRTQESLIVNSTSWRGNYLLVIQLTNNTRIVFGANRPISEQLEDYEVVTKQLTFTNKSYTEINLSSKKISVQ